MSIYDFSAVMPNGEQVSLSKFKGKVILIVNTASKCQFTPQYDDLQKLYERYEDAGLVILGFPCNQFAEQEPGTSEEAASFCKLNYGVKFPVFAKVDVNGKDAHPLFQYLKKEAPFKGFDDTDGKGKLLKLIVSEKAPQWLTGDDIKWNFTKFLVDHEGRVIERYEPWEEPLDFEKDIAESLKKRMAEVIKK